jgi:6-phosphogluconolactonase
MIFSASRCLVPAFLLLWFAGCTSSEEGAPATTGSGGSAGSSTATSSGGGGSSTGNTGGAGVSGTGGSDLPMDASSTMDSSGGGGPVESGPPPASAYVYLNGSGPAITILSLDMATGKLSPKGSSPAGSSVAYMAFSPDKQFLYAINAEDGPSSKVFAFKVNRADGSLMSINNANTGGDGAAHVAVHPGGKLVAIAHYNSGHVSTFKVDANGGVVMPPADVQQPVDRTSHQIVYDPAGKFLFVPNVDSNTIFQYAVEPSSGKLTANGQVTGFPAGAGPRHLAMHPSGKFGYTINEVATTVTSLAYDFAAGKLSNAQTVDSLPVGAVRDAMTSGAHIVVHPSGKFVYSSNRGHNSISLFAIDAASGRLTLTANETAGGMMNMPRDFGMDPSGKYLIVANQDAASAMVFEINPVDGKLTLRDTMTTPARPTFVGIVFL